MHLQSLTRRLAAFGLIGALALVLAFAAGTLASAQDASGTPVTGGGTTLPSTGTGSTVVSQATPVVGGDTVLPNTGTGSTVSVQATPVVGGNTGGDTTLPSTGTGDASQTGFGGLLMVLAAAAAVVVAAVSARTFTRRNS